MTYGQSDGTCFNNYHQNTDDDNKKDQGITYDLINLLADW